MTTTTQSTARLVGAGKVYGETVKTRALSPTTISMPFKLLLFVLVDGWYMIAKGLVVGYL